MALVPAVQVDDASALFLADVVQVPADTALEEAAAAVAAWYTVMFPEALSPQTLQSCVVCVGVLWPDDEEASSEAPSLCPAALLSLSSSQSSLESAIRNRSKG